jgi:DNA-binding MarR family transcriptional regulator
MELTMSKKKLLALNFFIFILFINITTLSQSLLHKNNQSEDLQIIYPNGGEILSGNVSVRWILAPEYATNVSYYNVYYSPDNGLNWIQLTFAYMSTSYQWNTAIFETYGTNYLIKITAFSKEWGNKETISERRFSIDNRKNILFGNITIDSIISYGLVALVLAISSITIGYTFYSSKNQQRSFSGLFQLNKSNFLKEISQKVIIGLDNIKSEFIDESIDIPALDAAIAPSSIVEYFPSDFQYDLRSEIKGRTVLTLIEIAYQDPSDTNPAKLAKSLNIPLSTLSKEIKRLRKLNYVETHISTQVVQDARFRNFRITNKGFNFLSVLNTALKVTISRVKRNGMTELIV